MYSHRPPADTIQLDVLLPMFFRTVMIAFQSDTTLMAICSTFGWKPNQRFRQTCKMSFSMRADCVAKNVLTEKMQETMDRFSNVCDNYDLTIRKTNDGVGYSQHMESPKWNQPSQWLDKDCKLLIKVTYLWGSLSTSVPLMMRSLPGLLKPV